MKQLFVFLDESDHVTQKMTTLIVVFRLAK